ncbi:MAG: hypothetical protein NTU76_00175 [Candidatus Taylorbacteria bacterium]|nr:hypothetical protein [Candidatus Taylorbacteria bacterium]
MKIIQYIKKNWKVIISIFWILIFFLIFISIWNHQNNIVTYKNDYPLVKSSNFYYSNENLFYSISINETDFFTKLRKKDIDSLSKGEKMVYCYSSDENGNYYCDAEELNDDFFQLEHKYQTKEDRLIRIENSYATSTLNLKTESDFSLGNFTIREVSIGDSFDDENTRSCNIQILKEDKKLTEIKSDQYVCSDFMVAGYKDKYFITIVSPFSGGNDYSIRKYLYFIDKDNFYKLGSFDMDWIDKSNMWTDGKDFYFWARDGRYESDGELGSHANTTYSFFPRIFKISTDNNILKITEGVKISKEINDFYLGQLKLLNNIFTLASNSATLDEISNDLHLYSPYFYYWVATAKYALNGKLESDELDRITKLAKNKFLVDLSLDSKGRTLLYNNFDKQNNIISDGFNCPDSGISSSTYKSVFTLYSKKMLELNSTLTTKELDDWWYSDLVDHNCWDTIEKYVYTY